MVAMQRGHGAPVTLYDSTDTEIGTATTPLAVSGSFSATLAGFTPNGSVATLAVTSSTGNVALPTGTVVAVTNTGATDCSIKLSVGASTAATTDWILKSGAAVGLTVGSNTYINAITASSTTTLSIAGGTGLVTGFGGGGASSGGAVTNAGTFAVQPAGSVAHDAAATSVNPNPIGGYASAAAPTDVSADGDSVRAWMLRNGAQAVNITAAGALIPGDATNGLKVQVTAATGVSQGADTSGQTLSPIGIRTLATSPTDTTAKTNLPVMDTKGALLTQPYGHNDNHISGLTAAMTGTTSTAVTGIGAPGASTYNYITQLTVGNSHATVGTFVELQDGSGGTTFYTVPAAAVYGGAVITFPKPLKQPTANTALYCKCTTTGSNTIVSASGFKGP